MENPTIQRELDSAIRRADLIARQLVRERRDGAEPGDLEVLEVRLRQAEKDVGRWTT